MATTASCKATPFAATQGMDPQMPSAAALARLTVALPTRWPAGAGVLRDAHGRVGPEAQPPAGTPQPPPGGIRGTP